MYENGKHTSVSDSFYLFQKKPRMLEKAMPWHFIQKKNQKIDFSHFPTFPDISRHFPTLPTFPDCRDLSGQVGTARGGGGPDIAFDIPTKN